MQFFTNLYWKAKTTVDPIALHTAVIEGKLSVVEHLLANRERYSININFRDYEGTSALQNGFYHAHEAGVLDCIFALLEAGASPFILDNQGGSIFHIDLYARRIEMLKLCLWHLPNPECYKATVNERKERADTQLARWDRQEPGVKQQLNDTVLAIKCYQKVLRDANALVQQAPSLTDIEQKAAYLKAAKLYQEAAEIHVTAMQQMEQNKEEEEKWPNAHQAVSRHYGKKALTYYLSCSQQYEMLDLNRLSAHQQSDYLEVLVTISELQKKLGDSAQAKMYLNRAAEYSFQLMRDYADTQQSDISAFFLGEADNCYQQYLAFFYGSDSYTEQDINYLNKAAQHYAYLAATVEDKESYHQTTLEIYNRLISLCRQFGKPEQSAYYQRVSQALETLVADASPATDEVSSSPVERERVSISQYFPHMLYQEGVSSEREPLWPQQTKVSEEDDVSISPSRRSTN